MPTIRRFSANTSAAEIAASLSEDGVAIVEKLLGEATVDELWAHLAPVFEAQVPGGGAFFGGRMKKASGLFARGRAFSDHLLTNPLVNDVAQRILGKSADHYRVNVSGATEIWEGGTEQFLHREIDIFHPYIRYSPDMPEYILFMMFSVSEFTSQNGATRLVPGSHRWPASRTAEPDEITQAEMPRGSVVFWLGKTIHALGANRTPEPRRSMAFAFSAAWLAQEENQFVAVPPEEARQLSREAQQLLGYRATDRLGWVGGKNSECLLEPAASGKASGPTYETAPVAG